MKNSHCHEYPGTVINITSIVFYWFSSLITALEDLLFLLTLSGPHFLSFPHLSTMCTETNVSPLPFLESVALLLSSWKYDIKRFFIVARFDRILEKNFKIIVHTLLGLLLCTLVTSWFLVITQINVLNISNINPLSW